VCSPNKTALLSADYSPEHYLVVAGTELHSEEAHLLYWDIRSPSQLLRQHSSTHSDDITSVSLHKSEGSYRLLSASTDGLLCSSNPLENDEDESVLSVANWGTSISKTGFVNESVWSLSDMETLAFWDNEVRVLTVLSTTEAQSLLAKFAS
jgi:WD repeat-containing protein 89